MNDMNNPIQYLLSQMVQLHNETALLEICDWDEDKVERLLSNLNHMLIDLSSPLEENLTHFCESQDYISETNRDNLCEILDQAILLEMKNIANPSEEYEN